MVLPQMMFKIWDGDPDERFTYRDMNRIEDNINILAREAGLSQVTFVEADRSQQFRYDEVQRVENLTLSVANAIGQVVTTERNWGANRSLSYIDFERIEANMYLLYLAMGGVGERIPDNKRLVVVSATLFPDAWSSGTTPYIDLEVPMVHPDSEVFAFVPHYATVSQRTEEHRARLSASIVADKRIRIRATGVIPRNAIPVRIALGGLPMLENKTLSSSGWSGSGPWTQTVSLSESPENAVVGMAEGITPSQSRAFARAGIHVSAVSGSTMTIRAIYEKPTESIPVAVLYSTESVA